MENWFVEQFSLELCSLQSLHFVECVASDFAELVRNLNGLLRDSFWNGVGALDRAGIRSAKNVNRNSKQKQQQCDCDFHRFSNFVRRVPLAEHAFNLSLRTR